MATASTCSWAGRKSFHHHMVERAKAGPLETRPPRISAPVGFVVEARSVRPRYTSSCHGRVMRLAGPWYAAGGWWQRALGWQREEWDVELEPAGLYRLVHTPAGWFVEGEYD